MTTFERKPEKDRAPTRGLRGTPSPRLSLSRVPLSLIDRWLPAKPAPFLAVVFAMAAACWLAGFLLADDKRRFLASRDWQAQPVYLAVHFVILRMFVTAYAKNFLAGCQQLTIGQEDAEKRMSRALGPWGWLCALALAAPFVWFDLAYMTGPEYVENGEAQGPGGALGPADWLAGAIWTVEWIINAYVWIVILGFLALTMRVLKANSFNEEIEVVLAERHYRPFLLMSAQGASIVLGFSIASALYVWHVEGETTDYLGLWITAGLLVVGFVPPWLRLKSGIARLARNESDRLNREIQDGWKAIDDEGPRPSEGKESVLSRLNLLLTLARAGHLERLYRDLGRNEGQAMLLRLLAPLSTVVWKLFRPG